MIFLGTAGSSLPNEQFWVSLVGTWLGPGPPEGLTALGVPQEWGSGWDTGHPVPKPLLQEAPLWFGCAGRRGEQLPGEHRGERRQWSERFPNAVTIYMPTFSMRVPLLVLLPL